MCRIKTVLCDMDGVFADLEGMVIRILRAEFPRVRIPTPEERNTFYLDEQIALEHRHLVKEIIARPGFFLSLKPVPGAIEGLRRIASIPDVNLAICTSPLQDPTYCVPEKYEWVERYLGPRFLSNMIMTRDKTVVEGDIMLEDNSCIKGVNVPTWELILHHQMHNRASKKMRFTWDDRVEPGFKWLYEYIKYE